MDIQGRIKMIGSTQQVSQSFQKRELVVTTNEQYPQNILIEFHQDRTNLLDGMNVGDFVKVSINLRGREWVSPQGETKYFNSIQGWKIQRAGSQPQYQDQQGYMQNGQYHGQGSAVDAYQNQQQYMQAQQPFPSQEDTDDLPF